MIMTMRYSMKMLCKMMIRLKIMRKMKMEKMAGAMMMMMMHGDKVNVLSIMHFHVIFAFFSLWLLFICFGWDKILYFDFDLLNICSVGMYKTCIKIIINMIF